MSELTESPIGIFPGWNTPYALRNRRDGIRSGIGVLGGDRCTWKNPLSHPSQRLARALKAQGPDRRHDFDAKNPLRPEESRHSANDHPPKCYFRGNTPYAVRSICRDTPPSHRTEAPHAPSACPPQKNPIRPEPHPAPPADQPPESQATLTLYREKNPIRRENAAPCSGPAPWHKLPPEIKTPRERSCKQIT